MKPSLAVLFFFTAFTTAFSSSSVSLAEEVVKKYDNRNQDIDATAAASRAVPSRNLESIHTTSKAGKSSAYCPPEPTQDVECGKTYINSTVILGENLICNENITQADGSRNAALTLTGGNAVLDCRGYTISQTTVNINGTDTGSTAALDCDIFPSSADREETKRKCGIFYIFGVYLKDGASMKHCNIQQFYTGVRMDNGGGIEGSDFSLNKKALEVVNFPDAANTVSKVAHSKFYNNYDGLSTFQLNKNNAKVVIEDVIANNNQDTGIYLTGTGITANNANIMNNPAGLKIGNFVANEITLAGDIFITNNEFGFYTDPEFKPQGTVYVTGNLNSNRNKIGLLGASENFTLAVGGSYLGKSGKSGSGSLTACDNTLDIDNFGGSNFEGSDYTCEHKKTFGPGLPDCKPCPGCL